MIRPVIAITHARFDPRRKQSLARLMSQLGTEACDIPITIACDDERKGSLWCWKQAMDMALMDQGATHIVWLPDDAIVCKDFGRILTACIEARPDDVFDCYVNKSDAAEVRTCWYSTPDGYVGMGGVMPRALLLEHLRWRETEDLGDYSNDGGVNLWAIDTGRLIYKTAWTLVQHDGAMQSLDGNDAHGFRRGLRWVDDDRKGILLEAGNFLGRTYMAPEQHMPGRARSCTALGRTYKGNHWDLIRKTRPETWTAERIEAMYTAERGAPTGHSPHVLIVTPVFGEPASLVSKTDESRRKVVDVLLAAGEDHGIEVSEWKTPGDSLVQRMRQRVVHQFLKSPATHMLWWDADIECLTPDCVLAMLRRGHDVIAGACPMKDKTGRVVCNLRDEDLERGSFTAVGGCMPVKDAGTGFMLVSRKAIVTLMAAHPELMHLSLSTHDHFEPLWAIYDTAVVDNVYLSEDYHFCRLWQRLGGTVYVYVPAKFRHWGMHGYEGSLEQQWGLEVAQSP